MRILGIILILGGVVSLMINYGIGYQFILPVVAIIVGFMVKHGCGHMRCCGMGSGKGGFCEMKSGEGNHKCEGAGCGECKK